MLPDKGATLRDPTPSRSLVQPYETALTSPPSDLRALQALSESAPVQEMKQPRDPRVIRCKALDNLST